MNPDAVIKALLVSQELITPSDKVVYIQDFDELSAKLKALDSSFSIHTTHAVAIKANPLLAVLQFIEKQGKWVEAASLQEVKLAVKAGFSPDRIVFDSPVKTQEEINWCKHHLAGSTLNVNALDELQYYSGGTPFKLGLRVTLDHTTTSHASMNVAGSWSKFGISISKRKELLEAIESNQSITDLHIHQGSQFDQLTRQVNGIRTIVDLAIEANHLLNRNQIKRINIGGGFPVNYEGPKFPIQEYADALKEACPELWDGTFKVLTEFGRYTNAHAGAIATRVEYVKKVEQGQILLTHSGADMLLRESYQVGEWPHKLTLLTNSGEPRHKAQMQTQVAGPLCFGGDFPFRNVHLPEAEAGDWLFIHDAGANSLGLWSKHCSRAFPKVIGINGEEIQILKERQTDEEAIAFWG